MRLHTTEATQYADIMGAASAACAVSASAYMYANWPAVSKIAPVYLGASRLGMSFYFLTPRTYTAHTMPTTRKVSSYATFAESSLRVSSTRLSANVPSASSRQ